MAKAIKKSVVDAMMEDANHIPTTKEIGDVMVLINKYTSLEADITKLSEQMDVKKAEMYKLSTVTIPEKLNSVGVSELKLLDGSKIQIKQFYSASIDKEDPEPALEWLRENNLGDVIKHEFKVQLGKGEDSKAEKLKTQLAKLKMNYIDVEGVHPQTLKALVKEQIESIADKATIDAIALKQEQQELEGGGKTFPMKLFNVFIGNQTKIVKPK